MGVSIDLVADTAYEGLDNGVLDEWRKHHPEAIPVLTVRQALDAVRSRSGMLKVDRLRIFGHGREGRQWVGGGFNGREDDLTRLNVQTIRSEHGSLQDRAVLAQLVGRFDAGGMVELHGCSVGVGPEGHALARSLAALWNVRVRAGTALQRADAPGSYEGGYIEAQPNGIIQSFTAGVPGFLLIPPPVSVTPPVVSTFHQVGAVVTKADWLSSIAQTHYGDVLLWPVIYDKNKPVLPQGPNVIKPNQKFEIPPIKGYTPQQLADIRKRGLNWRT